MAAFAELHKTLAEKEEKVEQEKRASRLEQALLFDQFQTAGNFRPELDWKRHGWEGVGTDGQTENGPVGRVAGPCDKQIQTHAHINITPKHSPRARAMDHAIEGRARQGRDRGQGRDAQWHETSGGEWAGEGRPSLTS